MRFASIALGALVAVASGTPAIAEEPVAPPTAACCQHRELAGEYGIIWTGFDPVMTAERLAAYAAPILWFSPDEPLPKDRPRRLKGEDIAIPTPFPFEEESEKPVVYFRVRRILQRLDEPGEGTYVASPEARGRSQIDLRKVAGIDLDFFFYYPMDMGGTPTSTTSSTSRPASRWHGRQSVRNAPT